MSTEDDLRDQLRRADERVVQLRAANASLEHGLLRATASQVRLLGCVVAALFAGTVGFLIARSSGDARLARESRVASGAHAEKLGRDQAFVVTCKLAEQDARYKLSTCQDELARPTPADLGPRPTRSTIPPGPLCACQLGDPLCSCL